MDGHEATRRIMKIERANYAIKHRVPAEKVDETPVNLLDIRVVAVTAYVDKQSVTNCRKNDMIDVIHKPVSYREISGIMTKHYYREKLQV